MKSQLQIIVCLINGSDASLLLYLLFGFEGEKCVNPNIIICNGVKTGTYICVRFTGGLEDRKKKQNETRGN